VPTSPRRLASKRLVDGAGVLSIEDDQDARKVVSMLNKSQREILLNVLSKSSKVTATESPTTTTEDNEEALTKLHWRALFLANLLPFVGFGLLDNLLMILAGEYIDKTLGVGTIFQTTFLKAVHFKR